MLLLLPLLASLLPATLAAIQTPFSPPSSSSYHPTSISHSIEVGGSLTRSTTSYVLASDGEANGAEWVVGVKGQQGFVEAWEGKSGTGRKELAVRWLGTREANITYYALRPSSDLPKTTISLHSVTSHLTVPLPASLPQVSESISMLWSADLLDPLAGLSEADRAKVEEVKIRVKTPTPRILEIKPPQGFEMAYSKGGAVVTFMNKGSLAGLEPQVASVHYQQPEAVTSIRKLDRIVEVSHWGGNLAFTDAIDLVNSGPLLKGRFSRLDHQKATMHRRNSPLAITSLALVLPPNIHSPYFIDIVGNVSTSRFRPSSPSIGLPSQRKKATASLLELTPRYPLMGGWNYTFTVGYDAPLGEFVKRRGSEYVLAVPFLTPVKDVAVDDVSVSIRLPEGARNIRVHTPFPVDQLEFPTELPSFWPGEQKGYVKTYLDTTGRPTVILKKVNCGDRHGGDVLIEYTVPVVLDYLQKPLAAATVLSSVFLFTILVKRIEWGIGK